MTFPYRHTRLALVASCLAALATPLYAAPADTPPSDDEPVIVVSATRTPTPLDEVATSITVITEQQLEATGQTFVSDALRDVPGLYVSQSGGPGHLTYVYLRGANSGDTLVTIDGVPVNDPSSPNRTYDFSNLTVDNIERIEVLRGPQGTLYGSDALAGVINIITKRGSGKPKSSITLDGGSYGTAEGRIASSGSLDAWRYSASASRFATDGFPVADLQPEDNHNDGYNNTTLSGRLDRDMSPSLSLDFTGHYDKGHALIGSFPAPNYNLADDGTHTYDTEQSTVRAEAHWKPVGSKWDNTFGAGYNSQNNDSFDVGTGQDPANSNFRGQTYRFDYQGNYAASDKNLITVGAERSLETANYDSVGDSSPARHDFNTGVFVQDQITILTGWYATAGVRADDYEPFGSKATYRFTSSYQIPRSGPRIKATYGTGFKAPSLFDLYDPNYGNPNLKPEESESYDLGFEQAFDRNKGALSATYFHNDYKNLIGFDDNFVTDNILTAEAHGLELIASYHATRKLHADLNYTYTHSEGVDGQPLPRRPSNLYGATLSYDWTEKLNVSLDGNYVGDRIDTAAFPPVTLPNYALVNLAANYKITPEYKAFVRVDNLFDKHYEEVYAYATARRGVYGGVNVSF